MAPDINLTEIGLRKILQEAGVITEIAPPAAAQPEIIKATPPAAPDLDALEAEALQLLIAHLKGV